MTRLSWWLVEQASRLLDPEERDAVRGDFAEWETTGGAALRDLAGLIVRRQILAWTDWRPWAGLVGLVAPLGIMLSLVSRNWATGSAIYAWLYVNNWTWGYLGSPMARLGLADAVGDACLMSLALMVWSWTAGFALAALSRRAIWFNGPLFCVTFFAGTLGSTTPGLINPGNSIVFTYTFYRVAYPLLIRIVLMLLPAVWGMRQGVRPNSLSARHAIVCVVLVGMLTALNARLLENSVIFGWASPSAGGPVTTRLWQWHRGGSWLLHLLPFVMVWPAAYVAARASSRRWSDASVSH